MTTPNPNPSQPVPTPGITLRTSGSVAELVLDRPAKRNAMTFEMWAAVPGLVARVAADDAVAVLVVRGEGAHMSAGADISEFGARRSQPADVDQYIFTVEAAERALIGLAKPSVAMISGYCLGGGCELALACDMRIAGDNAVLGITASRLGIVYTFLSTQRLVAAVGPSYAKYVLATGDHIDAAEALRSGLVDKVVPAAELTQHTTSLVRTIAERSQVSVRGALATIDAIAAGATEPDRTISTLPAASARSDDYREGVRAFLDKRPPVFTGR